MQNTRTLLQKHPPSGILSDLGKWYYVCEVALWIRYLESAKLQP
jgi:hypothetical protein